jgi:hypothetical protein
MLENQGTVIAPSAPSCLIGFLKTIPNGRYPEAVGGIAENRCKVKVMAALINLYLVRRQLMAMG